MKQEQLKTLLDNVLQNAVSRAGGVPGVVAMVTDKEGTIYEGVFGYRNIETKQPMSTDTVFSIFSTTKPITGLVLMKLVEDGVVSLDDPVSKYVPEIQNIEVLLGFEADGTPQTKKPDREITVEMLMLHTAGFSYEFFSEDDAKYRQAKNIPTALSNTFEGIQSVLLFEPGTSWCYGTNIDWIGKIIENVTGMRLGEAMRKYVFDPLHMENIAFEPSDTMKERRAHIHTRAQDGQLLPNEELGAPVPVSMEMGGGGLYASVDEYMKFIRLILNEGANVVSADTVKKMLTNGLGELKSGGWKTSNPFLSNDGEFFPGYEKSWSYTFQVNDTPLPTGRPANQVMWAGLANCYFWIDTENGIGGYWATQILPFHDPASYLGYLEFESAVYAWLSTNKKTENKVADLAL